MVTIHLGNVDGRSFDGYVFSSELSDAQLAKLEFNRDDAPTIINCGGDFTVEWDLDTPQVVIDLVFACSDKNSHEFNILDLDLSQIDTRDLIVAIEDCGQEHEWRADREAALEDFNWDQ